MKIRSSFQYLFIISLFAFSLQTTASTISINDQAEDLSSGNGRDFSAFELDVAFLNIDSTAAKKNGVDDSALGLSLDVSGRKKYLVGGVGLAFYALKDRARFDVLVEDQYGDVSTESSSVDAYSFKAEVGVSFPVYKNSVYSDLLVGMQSFNAERAVDYCSDCPSSNLKLDGGMFIKPAMRIFINKKSGFTFEYQAFLNSDLASALSIGYFWRY